MATTSSLPQDDKGWESYIDSISQKIELTSKPSTSSEDPSAKAIAASIDHTLLATTATEDQVRTLCAEALQHSFATVCVRLNHVALAKKCLSQDHHGGDSHVPNGTTSSTSNHPRVCCVVGFPSGEESTSAKTSEAQQAMDAGAAELDMVLNYPLLLDGKYTAVYDDVLAVRQTATTRPTTVLKVILETSQLSQPQIIAATVLAVSAGADFVKTSTGFKGAGATVENVRSMSATVRAMGRDGQVRVKASGGIRSADNCRAMMAAGASRIGASAGVKIVQELKGGGEGAVATKGDAGGY